MLNFIWAYLISIGAMTAIDSLWLSKIAPAFYKKHIGFILADKPNLLAAVAFYLIFIFGVTLFVVYPGWNNHQALWLVALKGAAFGLVTYATYDLTNQSTLKNWPAIITVVDMIWGTVLVAGVSVAAVAILRAVIK